MNFLKLNLDYVQTLINLVCICRYLHKTKPVHNKYGQAYSKHNVLIFNLSICLCNSMMGISLALIFTLHIVYEPAHELNASHFLLLTKSGPIVRCPNIQCIAFKFVFSDFRITLLSCASLLTPKIKPQKTHK